MRVSRCLPRETVSTTVPPARSAVAMAGTRKSVRTSVRPDRPRSRRRAVRQTASPSGTSAARGSQPQPTGGGDEPGGVEGRAQRGGSGAQELLPVGALDGDPTQRATTGCLGQGVGGGLEQLQVVGPGQQGLAAALDVQREGAVDEDDHGAGLATGAVSAA